MSHFCDHKDATYGTINISINISISIIVGIIIIMNKNNNDDTLSLWSQFDKYVRNISPSNSVPNNDNDNDNDNDYNYNNNTPVVNRSQQPLTW